MAWELDICGDEAISMPENEKCDECAEFAERLAGTEDALNDLEALLQDYKEYAPGANVEFTDLPDGKVEISATGGGGGALYTAGPGIRISGTEISADVRREMVSDAEVSPSENAHAVGEYLIYNNTLYRVTAAIAVGDTITSGTNIEATSVGDEISLLSANLANMFIPFTYSYNAVTVAAGGDVTISPTNAIPAGYSVAGVLHFTTAWPGITLRMFNARTGQVAVRNATTQQQEFTVSMTVVLVKENA